GGQAQLEARAEGHVGAFVYAAHVRDVGGDRVLADFDRCAVEADVGDVVLCASVRAAAHLDVDLARELVADVHRLDALLDGLVETHRARDAELARVGPGAGDDVRYLPGPGIAEAELGQRAPYLI